MTAKQAQQYLLDVVERLEECYDGFELQFMGGEPLMEFTTIKEVSEWAWQYPFKRSLKQIFLVSNGTLLNDVMSEWFAANKNRICIGLSFDGTAVMQNENRSDSFSRVALNFFSSTWPKQTVKMTISPQSINGLAEGVKFLHEQGFCSVTADLAMGKNVRWSNDHLLTFSNQLHQLVDYYLASNDTKCSFSMLDIDIAKVMYKPNRWKKCACGEELVCIDCDGASYACHLFSPVAAGEKRADKSHHIHFDDDILFASDECKNCFLFPVCQGCCGMNWLCTGDVAKTDAFSCASFKIRFLIACEYRYRLAEKLGLDEDLKMIDSILTIYKQNNI